MNTIAQMLERNNREIRQRRFWASVDRLLARLIVVALAFAGTATTLALITQP